MEAPLTSNVAQHTTLFLGGGRITSALIAGLRLAGYEQPIAVYDRNPEKLRSLKREFGIEIVPNLESAIAGANLLILAVRPASVGEMINEVKRSAKVRPLLAISLAAGIPLKKLRAGLAAPIRWVRAMPSPVCRIARGVTAVTFDRTTSTADRKRVRELFERVGSVVEISERALDPFTATFSPSHGYHALTALAKAGQNVGLDSRTALAAATHALADSIFYWRDSGRDLAELLHEAATPGGTAAATMNAMDNAGYSRAVVRGLKAGIAQARKNARR